MRPAGAVGTGAGAGEGAGVGAGTGAGAGAWDTTGAGAAALAAGFSAAGAAEGAAGAAAGASTFSPGLPMAQSGAPIATWEPAGANCLRSVPSKKDSSSMVALSVSTSASMSPDLTESPSFLSHLTSVPTVMVSLSFGMSMIWAIGISRSSQFEDRSSGIQPGSFPVRP